MLDEPKSPSTPLFHKGGTERNSFESSPSKKGKSGGFKNLRTEGFYGNGYDAEIIRVIKFVVRLAASAAGQGRVRLSCGV
jgi:hypothetical protein